jgi:hypothetical protein
VVLRREGLSPAETALAITLQGVVNASGPRLWLATDGMGARVLADLQRTGTRVEEARSPWELLPRFRQRVKGAILCRLGGASLNVATALCGPLGGVALDESLLERARAAGLAVLEDVRGQDAASLFRSRRALFARGIVVEQVVEKVGYLRDLAVARRVFVFSGGDGEARSELVRAFGPEALVFGWGGDEHGWVRDLSRANASGVAADWSANLSALQGLPAPLRRPRPPGPPAGGDGRRVAFVMSDGDNIQWLGGGFVDHPHFWASPLRGTFPMTWEVSPVLADFAPRVLAHFYRTATGSDGFVTGAGAPGYTFPHFQTDRAALARQAAGFLGRADLAVVSVLNDNAGSPRDTMPLLELAVVHGILYKDFAPYHRRRGELFWHAGKPCLAYHGSLWEGLPDSGPEAVARTIAALPAAPATDPASYALVNVHAWSYRRTGGPLAAVRKTIDLLPPGTRIVTAETLLRELRDRFGQA